jgi:hypothetical protein
MNTLRLTRSSALALALAFIAFAVGFRLLRATALPDLPNFSPVMAIALCGALVLPGALALLVPLVALIGSDILLNFHYNVALLSPGDLLRDACYGLGVAAGLGLRRMNAGAPAIFATVLANALLFYVVTNTASWLGNPAYAQTAAGWLQALTVGVPGFPPTWTFFRNSLVSDLLFTGAFLVAIRFAARKPRAVVAHASL